MKSVGLARWYAEAGRGKSRDDGRDLSDSCGPVYPHVCRLTESATLCLFGPFANVASKQLLTIHV